MIDPAAINLRPQRDRVSSEWRDRFLAERGDLGSLESLANVPVMRWAAIRWPGAARVARRLRGR